MTYSVLTQIFFEMNLFALILATFILSVSSVLGLKDPVCGLQHVKDGNGLIACAAYIPSWSYKADANECVDFVYGGCGGNLNRFDSKKSCEDKCKE